ncbi:hypothetical protein [Tropicimonas marinistellae]|uniref:hypothetical protein n=1 Tax=Tropicimonas marinistellae TaxID=1739787 RepID=UPI0008379FA7|nr:hypothetical protein [Tropicimonas marinistellae]
MIDTSNAPDTARIRILMVDGDTELSCETCAFPASRRDDADRADTVSAARSMIASISGPVTGRSPSRRYAGDENIFKNFNLEPARPCAKLF